MNQQYLQELRVRLMGVYIEFERSLSKILPRNKGLKLKLYRSGDPNPWIRARRTYVERRVSKSFEPLIKAAREAERINGNDLSQLVY